MYSCARAADTPSGACSMTELPRYTRHGALTVATVALLTASAAARYHSDIPLASLDLAKMRVQPAGGRGQTATTAQANKSIDGNPLRIGGREFAEGVGTRA